MVAARPFDGYLSLPVQEPRQRFPCQVVAARRAFQSVRYLT